MVTRDNSVLDILGGEREYSNSATGGGMIFVSVSVQFPSLLDFYITVTHCCLVATFALKRVCCPRGAVWFGGPSRYDREDVGAFSRCTIAKKLCTTPLSATAARLGSVSSTFFFFFFAVMLLPRVLVSALTFTDTAAVRRHAQPNLYNMFSHDTETPKTALTVNQRLNSKTSINI